MWSPLMQDVARRLLSALPEDLLGRPLSIIFRYSLRIYLLKALKLCTNCHHMKIVAPLIPSLITQKGATTKWFLHQVTGKVLAWWSLGINSNITARFPINTTNRCSNIKWDNNHDDGVPKGTPESTSQIKFGSKSSIYLEIYCYITFIK